MSDWAVRADKAANFLIDTDEQLAQLHNKVLSDKKEAERKRSAIYDRLDGVLDQNDKPLPVRAREAKVELHAEVESADAAWLNSLLEFEKLRNRRDTADKIIDYWRSWQRAKSQGLI